MRAKLYEYIGAAFLEWQQIKSSLTVTGVDDEFTTYCEVRDCRGYAEYSGYWRAVDPVTDMPTGLIQLREVCKEHAPMLIGWYDKEST